MNDFSPLLLEDEVSIFDAIRDTKTIAVLGIKPDSHAGQPAHDVPAYMQEEGYDVVPVPVYYPEVTTILGEKVCRSLAEIGRPIDMVDVFRKPQDIPQHLDDIVAARPKYVWFQLGIRNDEAAERLAREGIRVIQNRCLMVEHARMQRR